MGKQVNRKEGSVYNGMEGGTMCEQSLDDQMPERRHWACGWEWRLCNPHVKDKDEDQATSPRGRPLPLRMEIAKGGRR